MKIILIGASGTLGQAVANELGPRHEILRVGRSSGDYRVDITDSASIRALFEHCLLYTSPSPRDRQKSRMPSSA